MHTMLTSKSEAEQKHAALCCIPCQVSMAQDSLFVRGWGHRQPGQPTLKFLHPSEDVLHCLYRTCFLHAKATNSADSLEEHSASALE